MFSGEIAGNERGSFVRQTLLRGALLVRIGVLRSQCKGAETRRWRRRISGDGSVGRGSICFDGGALGSFFTKTFVLACDVISLHFLQTRREELGLLVLDALKILNLIRREKCAARSSSTRLTA